MKPDPRLQALWADVGEAIDSGDVQGIFLVYRDGDEPPNYGLAYLSANLDDMLLQVRLDVTRVRGRIDNEQGKVQ